MGIFETMKVTAAGIVVPVLHWKRMRKGGGLLGIPIPEYAEWLKRINMYLSETQIKEFPFALRAEVRLNAAQKPHWVFNTRAVPYTGEQYEKGVPVLFMPEHRTDPISLNYIKSTDYLDTAVALRMVQDRGAFEGIWLNSQGQIIEGTRTNVFFAKDGRLYTPSLESGCLAGIKRQLVIEKALELGIPFCEGRYSPEDLLQADEIFLSNSLMEIMPVRELEQKIYQVDGRIRRILQAIGH